MQNLRFAVVLAAATFAMTPISYAADQCSCVTAASRDGTVGQVLSTKGEVLASGVTDYGPVKRGTPIKSNSEIIVPANGSATIALRGTCGSLGLAGGTVTSIAQGADGNICVMSTPVSSAPAGAPAGAPSGLAAATAAGLPVAPIAAAAAGAVGLGVLVAAGGKDKSKPVSP